MPNHVADPVANDGHGGATSSPTLAEEIFAGDGEMATRMRAIDWSASAFGPLESWPESLTTLVSVCLTSSIPFALYWGPDLHLLYNDAWRPIGRDKHPAILCTKGKDVWPEVWDVLGPMFSSVLDQGKNVWAEDALLLMHRSGYVEECYFSFNLSPARGKTGRVDGVVNIGIETTYRVLNERMTRGLRTLAAHVATGKTADEVCRLAAESLSEQPFDAPFAVFYRVDREKRRAFRAGVCGLPHSHAGCPPEVDLALGDDAASPWPFASVVETAQSQAIHDFAGKVGAIVGAAWPEPLREALVLPIPLPGGGVAGILVVGVSPRRTLDDGYRDYFGFLVSHVSAAMGSARVAEEERERAEQLAELDRAKTAFFSNVSHEFRTPLTLILGPIEDALGKIPASLTGPDLEAVHRSALRLLRLVNSLLDFSRIEAGRLQSSFEPTDLAVLTGGLAGSFQSLVESAGLKLIVDCPSLPHPSYVDPSHWEKIVLNLVSNAFKFTFEGQIAVRLRRQDGRIELSVSDTGTGIPAHELSRVFERFHRVEGSRSRSFEGTGIGLALVSELVKAHAGTLRVESTVGRGSTFVVSIPAGSDHLPQDWAAPLETVPARGSSHHPMVLEAIQWLRTANGAPGKADLAHVVPPRPPPTGDTRRVLVAEDNPDMREYMTRLLSRHWTLEVVVDGRAALESALARPPDLVVSDVMMPRMDGVALLRALRADPRTEAVPVILLSARAGEEAVLEGIETGADDYLVKPFSARELVTRIRTHLGMARVRQKLQAQLVIADRMSAVGTLAAGVAHEINNPLSYVMSNLDLIAEEIRALSGGSSSSRMAELADMVNEARQGAERVRKIVRGMKTFSRADDERRVPLDVQFVMELSINMAFHEIRHRARVVKDYGKIPLVEADEARLGQLFLNLLVNAAHAIPEGHIEKNEIRIVTRTDASDRAVIEVRDTGRGIPAELLNRVFDPFFTTKDVGQGTGLGLSICRNIVTSLGGEIAAESEAGLGSTFRVVLPGARPDAHPPREPRPISPPSAGRAGHVLVVDDDPMVGATLRRVLDKEHQVTLVTDGKKALDLLLGGQSFDVILSDLMMPNMTGMELHAELSRALPEMVSRMVFITGGAFTPAGRGFLDSVPNQRLEKPFAPQNLRALVRALVR